MRLSKRKRLPTFGLDATWRTTILIVALRRQEKSKLAQYLCGQKASNFITKSFVSFCPNFNPLGQRCMSCKNFF